MNKQPFIDAVADFDVAEQACLAAPSPQTRGARALAAKAAVDAYKAWKEGELAERMAEVNAIQHPTQKEAALLAKFREANPQAFAAADEGREYREAAMYSGLVLEDESAKLAAQKADDQHRKYQLNDLKLKSGQDIDVDTVDFS